ncbi:MAG: adenylate/guanylate cyclase domain-containing protein, partial [Parvibaculaceae bacterium]
MSAPSPIVGLGLWLAEAAEKHQRFADLHQAFCDRLLDKGLPIARSSLGLEVLHPELSGWQFIWASREVEIQPNPRGAHTTTDYLTSPARIADETWKPFRRRLDRPSPDLPMLEDMRQQGATDYVIFPLPFLDRNRSAFLSFATHAPEGFSDTQIQALSDAARLISPWMERRVLKRISIDLLNTYVGPRSGERVYRGAIERGAAEIIRAAIFMTDLRGFTRYSDTHPLDKVVKLLDRFFEAMVEAITAEGGEVLKFMGDALLAVFPEQEGDLMKPCQAAAQAARGAAGTLARIDPSLLFGIALHAGDIAYGNIGGRTRLDFTVIGP